MSWFHTEYRDRRRAIKTLLFEQVRQSVAEEQAGLGEVRSSAQISDAVNSLCNERAENRLASFEQLVLRYYRPRAFWFGVGQSLMASLIYTGGIVVAAVIISGFKLNPISLLFDQPPAAPKPTVNVATPTPTP